MTKIEGQVEEWKEILVDGSVADQLFTLEEISNHINEYPYKEMLCIFASIYSGIS